MDRELDLIDAGSDSLSISLTCSNRDLPQLLSYGGSQSDFIFENDGVVDGIRLLRNLQ
ncbi:type VI secretion system baseplate subunit TssF [Pseudomonas syringae]|uniref:type VI secretion system baseplate subunit TssF n=1 Tax=Pseudomonas syringae TaxID=317 RepID=UPI00404298E7